MFQKEPVCHIHCCISGAQHCGPGIQFLEENSAQNQGIIQEGMSANVGSGILTLLQGDCATFPHKRWCSLLYPLNPGLTTLGQWDTSECDATRGLHTGACPVLLMGTCPPPHKQTLARFTGEEPQHGERVQSSCQGPGHVCEAILGPPGPSQASPDKKLCAEL